MLIFGDTFGSTMVVRGALHKYNTIIETRTGDDPDDENLHNPETVQDAVIHLEVLFLTFSVLVANPKKLLYTVANPARGLLNREKRSGSIKY